MRKTEHLQGALDLLILQTLPSGPIPEGVSSSGFIRSRVRRSRSVRDRSTPHCTDLRPPAFLPPR
jgi:hypothetical protein